MALEYGSGRFGPAAIQGFAFGSRNRFRSPFGFKIRRGTRHIEKDHYLPAWLALKCAAILFHWFGADWA
jgi:hypothetical protein